MDGSVVGHVHPRPGFVGDPPNRLAARPDDLPDLPHGDLHGEDGGGVLGGFAPGSGNRGRHGLQDLDARPARLLESVADDVEPQSGDLDVHLQRGNPVGGARDLEVHVSVVVFGPRDVGQNPVLVPPGNEAHRDAGDGSLERHAGIHEGEASPGHRGHGTRPVGLEGVGHHPDGVVELFLARDRGQQGALGERSVPDFAPAGPTHHPGFSHGEGREVVVQEKALFPGAVHPIQALALAERRQGGDHERLRLPAGENRGTVSPGEDANLAGQLANLVERPPIQALSFLKDRAAEDVLFHRLDDPGSGGTLFVAAVFEAGRDGRLHLVDGAGGLDLPRQLHRGLQPLPEAIGDLGGQLGIGVVRDHHLLLRL